LPDGRITADLAPAWSGPIGSCVVRERRCDDLVPFDEPDPIDVFRGIVLWHALQPL